MDEAVYLKFDEIENGEPFNDPETKTKFLGITFEVKDRKLNVNWNDATFKFPQIKSCPGYTAIKYAKTYIVSKFRYYHNVIKIMNETQGKKYLEWFKKKLRIWLRKTLITCKIHNAMLDEIIQKSDKDEMYLQYYSPYLADQKFRMNLKEYGEKSEMLER